MSAGVREAASADGGRCGWPYPLPIDHLRLLLAVAPARHGSCVGLVVGNAAEPAWDGSVANDHSETCASMPSKALARTKALRRCLALRCNLAHLGLVEIDGNSARRAVITESLFRHDPYGPFCLFRCCRPRFGSAGCSFRARAAFTGNSDDGVHCTRS